MKLAIANDFSIHYLSMLSSFIRRYYRYNTDFNTAITGHRLLSSAYNQQIDDNSVYYTEFSGVSALF